jgi:hypothetical protein
MFSFVKENCTWELKLHDYAGSEENCDVMGTIRETERMRGGRWEECAKYD